MNDSNPRDSILALIIEPTGHAGLGDIVPGLDSFRSIVGGHIEPLRGDGWTGYCDEEGKLKGYLFNAPATEFCTRLGWNAGMGGDFLVGRIVLVGPPDSDGWDTDLPEDVVAKITDFFTPAHNLN